MSKVNITKVFRKDVETKYGIKPKISIQTKEYAEKWLSSFKVKGTEHWDEGMEVNINVQEQGDFLNFTPVATAGTPTVAVSPALEARVKKLEDKVFGQTVSAGAPDVDVDDALGDTDF